MSYRKIIHVDMDAFFASVEQRDNPKLRSRPIVVGGSPDSRGVVAACSYEARAFGVHSAMASAKAKRLCPDIIFVRPRFSAYQEVSLHIRDIFSRFTSLIEPLSLDEAYLDVSNSTQCQGKAILIAREIKRLVQSETNLIASAGVSYNKFLAKMASDMDKPDGLYVVLPDQGVGFVEQLPIGKFYGVGPATEKKMHALGIKNGADLKKYSHEQLDSHFGRSASYYYNIARGIDERAVEPSRERKSIGAETTFEIDLSDVAVMLEVLAQLAMSVALSLQQYGFCAQTLTIKVKYADFTQVTRSYSSRQGFETVSDMQACFPALIGRTDAAIRPVRLLGVSLSGLRLAQDERQLSLDLPLL
jgi:DNA polymerase-4